MGNRPSVDLVSGVMLFAGLSREEHERLAAIAELETLSPGTTIFREGDAAGDLYVILEGRITLSMQAPHTGSKSVLSLRSGEMLGFSALIARGRIATATAVLPSKVLRLPRSELLELCETDHHVGYAIMKQAFEEMADRLLDTRLQLLDLFGPRDS